MSLNPKLLQRAFLALTCFSVLAGTWLIFQLETGRHCLDTRFVRSLVLSERPGRQGAVSEYPLCHQEKITRGLFFESFTLLKEEIEAFESVVLTLGGRMEPIDIEIVERPAYAISLQPERLELGVGILKADGMFLKALNSVWLLQINKSLLENPLMSEVISDLLVAVQSGGLALRQPFTGKIARFSGDAGERKELSQKELCASAWLPLSQIGLCRSLRELAEVETDSALLQADLAVAIQRISERWSEYSAREFLGQSLWRAYMNHPLGERIFALKKIFEWVQSEDFSGLEMPRETDKWEEFVQTRLDLLNSTK